jgi:hypothetical protein
MDENSSSRPNLEKLVQMIQSEEEGGELIPPFLAMIEMCFHGDGHRV